MRNWLRYAAEGLLWWAATLGIWLLTLSSVTTSELEVAVPVSLACAAAAVAGRRGIGISWRLPRRALGWVLHLPAALVVDTAVMLSLPWRVLFGGGREGHLVRVPVASTDDDAGVMDRAAAAFLVSTTPGSVVLDDDDGADELVVHVMVEGRFGMQQVVRT
ncbi:MAG: Na+/H+ antiporter subunit E [Mycobacteriales bacterium]